MFCGINANCSRSLMDLARILNGKCAARKAVGALSRRLEASMRTGCEAVANRIDVGWGPLAGTQLQRPEFSSGRGR